MKNLKINRKAISILLLTTMISGTRLGLSACKKDSSDYFLKTMRVSEFLEDQNILNLTSIDEESLGGSIDIALEDEKFRNRIMLLEYYESAGEQNNYDDILNWLREHIGKYSEDLLLTAVKGAISEEENVDMRFISVYPSPDRNEDILFFKANGTVEIKKDYQKEGYIVKSELLSKAINLCADIQDTDFSEYDAKEIVEYYDYVVETAEMAIASGASRRDDKFYEKNSKKFIKKKYNI